MVVKGPPCGRQTVAVRSPKAWPCPFFFVVDVSGAPLRKDSLLFYLFGSESRCAVDAKILTGGMQEKKKKRVRRRVGALAKGDAMRRQRANSCLPL